MLRKVDKISKIIATILLVVMILTMVSTVVFATGWSSPEITPNQSATGTDKVVSIGKDVIGLVQVVGYVIAIVILVYIGIKYITASPDGKAEIKKTALFYVLGAILIAGAVTITKAVFDFGGQVQS